MTITTAARVDSWRATLATFLATGTTGTATATATPVRRRATRTATADDTAARHDRWRAALAAHIGPAAAPAPEPAAAAPRVDNATFLRQLLAGVTAAPAPAPELEAAPSPVATRPTRATRPAPRRTPAPHVARDRCAAFWQTSQPRPDRMPITTGRPWMPTRRAA